MSVDICERLITESNIITIAVGLCFISFARKKSIRLINLRCLIMEFEYIQFVYSSDNGIQVGTCRQVSLSQPLTPSFTILGMLSKYAFEFFVVPARLITCLFKSINDRNSLFAFGGIFPQAIIVPCMWTSDVFTSAKGIFDKYLWSSFCIVLQRVFGYQNGVKLSFSSKQPTVV